jgi:hypothetical protein
MMEQHSSGYGMVPKKKRVFKRVFMWVFFAVQALFLIWVIGGSVSGHSAAVHCHDQYLTHSQCASATNTGTAIGIGLVITFWAIVDVILGVSYGVYKLARR